MLVYQMEIFHVYMNAFYTCSLFINLITVMRLKNNVEHTYLGED